MDIRKVKKLIELLEESNIGEIEILILGKLNLSKQRLKS